MKYLNGGWLIRDGYTVDYAVNVYDATTDGKTLTLYAPFRAIKNMGDTLDGGLMTIEVTSPRPDIITTKLYHFKGQRTKEPHFGLNTETVTPKIVIEPDQCTFQSGDLKLVITRGEQMDFKYYFRGKYLADSPDRAKALVTDPHLQAHISDQFLLNVGEKIYGMGERFGNFVKNGQSIDIWNADGGTGTMQSYKNVPFYLSNRGYGVFINTPEKVELEVASEKVSRVQFSVTDQELEYAIIGADSMKGVLRKYTDLTGKPALPAAWTFGLWLSTSFTTDYTDKTVLDFVDGMQQRDIPLSVFHFDCLWMKELEWCNFMWDTRKFPDPVGLLKKLHTRGLKICVWINPYIAQKSPLFDEAVAHDYLIQRLDGSVWQWDRWQAGMGIVDFTNPAAVAWYQSKLKTLLDMGVDCFKTDFGERIPIKDIKYHDGSDPAKMHNYYTYLYNQTVYQLLQEVKGKKDAVVFARSATVGSQKFPVHWGGDNASNYPSMAESLRAGLSFGMSGFGYWAHDISGFEDQADPDLYKRWTQFGLLSSHSRYHGSNQYKVPWLYGDEAVAVSRKFTKLKLSLMPYLMGQAAQTHRFGYPMMRAMCLEFPDDLNTETLDQQYMLGDSLLIAPIFNAQGQGRFYVPKTQGLWTSLLDNKTYLPEHWYQEKYDYFNLPLLVRPNSILITGNHDDTAVYDYAKMPTIHLYELSEGKHTQVLTNEYGEVIDHIQVELTRTKIVIQSSKLNGFKVVLHHHGQIQTVEFSGQSGELSLSN